MLKHVVVDMKKALVFCALYWSCLFTFLFTGIVADAQTFSKRPSWRAEFNSIKLVPLSDWSILVRNYPTGNQFFTDSIGNVFVKNGCLHLKVTPDRREDKECSGAYVSTKDYKSFLYGKLEVKAKVPTGSGIFPSIWMLQVEHGKVWPRGEIDIMEYIECFEKKEYATTIHLTHRENGIGEYLEYTHTHNEKANMNKFHIFGMEWTPDFLTFTLDHKPYYTLKKEELEYWPFNEPYYLITGVGFGSWGAKCGMDFSILPREMIIDWVRYYPLVQNN